jgi:hypothetical protein
MKYLLFFTLIFCQHNYLLANGNKKVFSLFNAAPLKIQVKYAGKIAECDTCYTVQVSKYKSKKGKRKWLSFSKRDVFTNNRVISKHIVYKQSENDYIIYKQQKFFLNYDSIPELNKNFCNSFYEKFVDSLSDLVSFNSTQIIFLMLDSTGKILEHGNCTYRHEKYYADYIKNTLDELKGQSVLLPATIKEKPVNSLIAIKLSFAEKFCSISNYFSNGIYNYE